MFKKNKNSFYNNGSYLPQKFNESPKIGGNSRNKKNDLNSSLEFWGSAYENIKVGTNMSTIQRYDTGSEENMLMEDNEVEDL